MEHLHTTICALATPPGEGGIATVRVSGPDAYGIVGKIFAPVRQGKSVADAKGYTAMLGHYLLHGAEMDECVALFFRAPHSYTGEDIELSVHGGTAMADGLFEKRSSPRAARLPDQGEFTRRALENGRMSLTQAEAGGGGHCGERAAGGCACKTRAGRAGWQRASVRYRPRCKR